MLGSRSLGALVVPMFLFAPVSLVAASPGVYVSAFGGVHAPRSFDIRHQDPAFGEQGLFEGIDSQNAFEFGGDLGVWLRGAGSCDWGLRFQVGHSRPDIKAQTVHGFGVSEGEPFDLDFEAPATDIRVTTYAWDVLFRHRSGSSEQRPEGGFSFYGGPGVGVAHSSQETPDFGTSGSSTRPLFELVVGVEACPWRRLGLFGEYRYTWTEQVLDSMTLHEVNPYQGHHLVGGVRWHL